MFCAIVRVQRLPVGLVCTLNETNLTKLVSCSTKIQSNNYQVCNY
jgi:hypothetical protein